MVSFRKAFAKFDFVLTPTTPTAAYKLGEKSADPLAMYLDDIDTVLANLVGIAAVSVPAGKAENDMPCGVQFLAPAMQVATASMSCAVRSGRSPGT